MPENRGKTAVKACDEQIKRSDRRSQRINGLLRRQRTFLLEKLVGLNDKESALAAGYSLSVAENTKQKIWANPLMRAEFERLMSLLDRARSRQDAGL
jgi:hypothetical protein